ncbi:MAG: tetratricopeptide repeat protein [Planctomycetota bacterium]
MTTTIQNPTTQRSGFQTIPTRIRDLRDGQVPPLVVQPIAEQNKAAICQSLGELGVKLAEIHRTAGEAYMSQGLYEKALPHVQAAATFAVGESDYQMQLGFVCYVLGDDVGAINAFNTIITSEPTNAEAWFNLGMVLFGQEQYSEAEDCFRRSLETDASDAQTWNNRGVCLWKLDNTAQAKTCFQRALQIDPNDADAKFNLGSMG